MIFLPIVRRELAVASRRTATYRQRALFAGLATTTAAIMLSTTRFSALDGPAIFKALSWGGLFLCALEGMRATADSISLERREGTLGLLLLTGLRGRHIVVGKVAAASIQSISTVLSILPVFALPLLLGGVTAGECWRVMLTFVCMLLATMAAGTLVSTWARQSLTAFMGTAGLVLLISGGPWALGEISGSAGFVHALSGPLGMFLFLEDAVYTTRGFDFWLACGFALFWAIVFFAAAGALLERRPGIEEKNADTWLQKVLRPRPERAASFGGGTAQSNPSIWLATRTLPGGRVLWVLICCGIGVSFLAGLFGGKLSVPIAFGCQVVFAYLLKLWVAVVAPQSLNSSRRSGALELLLCTPLSPREIVQGQIDSLYSYFIWPAVAMK